jgi:hypothetical protein
MLERVSRLIVMFGTGLFTSFEARGRVASP